MMKKTDLGFLLFLLTLLIFNGRLLAKEKEEVRMLIAPAFYSLDKSKLEAFNAQIAGSDFEPFGQKTFPGIAISTQVGLSQSDLLFSSNTFIAIAVSEQEEKELSFAGIGFTFSLEKPLRLTDALRISYGGSAGYGISVLSMQFEKDGSLEDQLSAAKYSEAYQLYFLAGLKGGLNYQLTNKLSLTAQAQYLLPVGSLGTKGFNLPLSGPNVTVGLSFLLPAD